MVRSQQATLAGENEEIAIDGATGQGSPSARKRRVVAVLLATVNSLLAAHTTLYY
jgi:hypothetical protein